jgi:outer membrane protein assembly factor BamB
MDSSKIISVEDYIRKENRYPAEEEGLAWALQLCNLIEPQPGNYCLIDPRTVYIENDEQWTTPLPPSTKDPAQALFRLGIILHYLLTRLPFQISVYLDGPPSIKTRNPQISVRFETMILRLLSTVRSLGYSSVAEFKQDLENLRAEIGGDWTPQWPCFKGNVARTNYLSDKTFDPLNKSPKEIWRTPIGEVWASPVSAGPSIFIGAADGNFYSIDAKTGKVLWQLNLGARIESTACLADARAYLGNDLGMFYAINIKNGSILWRRSLGEHVRSSACTDGKNVYVGSINPARKSGSLWALAGENGSVIWKKQLGPVFSSPALDKGDLVVGSDDEQLYCVNTAGKDRWHVNLQGKVRGTPSLANDFLYVGGFGGTLYKMRRPTGEIIWRNAEAGSMYSSPATTRSVVVVGTNAGVVRFFSATAGKLLGEFAASGPVTASPLVVNQTVLVGSNDGFFYILDLKGKAMSSFDAKSPINSSAYYNDHMITVGTDAGLLALSF